jgi:hypothetical protein
LARVLKKREFTGSYIQNSIRRTAWFFEYNANKLSKIYSKTPLETDPVDLYNPDYELQLGPLDWTTKVNNQWSLSYDIKNRISEILFWNVQVNYPVINLVPAASHYTKFTYTISGNDSLMSKIESSNNSVNPTTDPTYNYINLISYDYQAKNPLFQTSALSAYPLLFIDMLQAKTNTSLLSYYVCLNPYILKSFTALVVQFNGPNHELFNATNSFNTNGNIKSSSSDAGIYSGGFSFEY